MSDNSPQRHIWLFQSRRPQPVEIGSNIKDLDELFDRIQKTTTKECNNWSRRAHDWGTWSVTLAILSALGSGAAGASVVAIKSLSPGDKTFVVIFAFAGAILGGIAAAVGAPSQAKDASLKSDQLASLERWASLSIVELPKLSHKEALERSRELLSWRDQIFGVTTPTALRSGVDAPNPSVVLTPGVGSS